MAPKTDPDLSFKLLKLLEENPDINQRQLAHELGLSLGKINYCLRALVLKGLIKARNFKNSNNKMAYSYLLTPHGIEEKVRLTFEYFQVIETQYETLRREVESLRDQNLNYAAAPVKDSDAEVKT